MLLDFNLAHDPADLTATIRAGRGHARLHGPGAPGGTDRARGRSDRPPRGHLLAGPGPPGGGRLAARSPSPPRRRRPPKPRFGTWRPGDRVRPRPREGGRSIPPAFRAVLRRCLAPDPADRYDTAAELAADLQAVADAAPLRFTREPMASRMAGWVRRNRLRMAVAIPIVAVLAGFTAAWFQAQADRLRRESEVRQLFALGRQWLDVGDCAMAAIQFETAAEQAEGWPGSARPEARRAGLREEALATDAIRARPTRSAGRPTVCASTCSASAAMPRPRRATWRPPSCPSASSNDPAWSHRDELGRLDPARRRRLLEEVNELLFLWVVAVGDGPSGRPGDGPSRPPLLRSGPRLRRAPRSLEHPARLVALAARRARAAARAPRRCRARDLGAGLLPVGPARQPPARSTGSTLAWLERARFLQPDNYWHQYALAFHLEQAGEVEGALQHYEAAVALRPAAPWAWFNRAHLYAYRQGAWSLALRDLDLAVAAAGDLPADRARFRIERGKVRQAVGDVLGARADFEAAIAADPSGRLGTRRSASTGLGCLPRPAPCGGHGPSTMPCWTRTPRIGPRGWPAPAWRCGRAGRPRPRPT